MAVVNKATLKGYFEQGDIPTQGQYMNLIDSTYNLSETGAQIIQGTLSASAAEIGFLELNKMYLPGIGVGTASIGTTFTVGNTLEVVGSIGGDVTFGADINDTHTFTGHITASGNISSSGDIIVDGNITASGTISSSGALYGERFYANGLDIARNLTAVVGLGNQNNQLLVNGDTITIGAADEPTTLLANITASGNISSSGKLEILNSISSSNELFIGHVTSSGNVSASAFYGDNMGPYYDRRVLMLPTDFSTTDFGKVGTLVNGGGSIRGTDASHHLYASYVIPSGMMFKKGRIFGDTNVRIITITEHTILNNTTSTLTSLENQASGEFTFDTTSSVGDGNKYITIKILPGGSDTDDEFYGGYLIFVP
jgi:hypothetical protein